MTQAPKKDPTPSPVTPAEHHAHEADDAVLTPQEKARLAEEASREEDA